MWWNHTSGDKRNTCLTSLEGDKRLRILEFCLYFLHLSIWDTYESSTVLCINPWNQIYEGCKAELSYLFTMVFICDGEAVTPPMLSNHDTSNRKYVPSNEISRLNEAIFRLSSRHQYIDIPCGASVGIASWRHFTVTVNFKVTYYMLTKVFKSAFASWKKNPPIWEKKQEKLYLRWDNHHPTISEMQHSQGFFHVNLLL